MPLFVNGRYPDMVNFRKEVPNNMEEKNDHMCKVENMSALNAERVRNISIICPENRGMRFFCLTNLLVVSQTYFLARI